MNLNLMQSEVESRLYVQLEHVKTEFALSGDNRLIETMDLINKTLELLRIQKELIKTK